MMTFPEKLKTYKVVPIRKLGKEPDTLEGWRPVNVVAAIAKVIERILLKQVLDHLDTNELIGHSHHGTLCNVSLHNLL